MSDISVRTDLITFEEIKGMIGREDPVVLDIGSNNGAHTNKFLDTFPECRVYSFEPDPRAITKWKKNVSSPRAHLSEIALGAQNGVAQFYASDGRPPGKKDDPGVPWDASGSLRRPKKHLEVWPWVKFERTIDVLVKALDTWATEHGVVGVDFIWADVQGAEGDLISGGMETLNNTRYFYTEYPNVEWYDGQITLDQIARLLPNCFELQALWGMDALFKNKNF